MDAQAQVMRKATRSTSAQPAARADGSIELNLDEIRKRAYNLAVAKRSYDDYAWLWAEQELKVGKALSSPLAPNVKSLKVDPSKIVDKPKVNDIKKLASDFAKFKTKVQDIHWYIAERQFIMDKAKGLK
ncbi:MAG TPA: hypothetical protein VKM55_20290 [Candidatus Lokiarchaeia archaeon]|nr:hypothetical protein [Candidatus Lokiarchaeia archaeon]